MPFYLTLTSARTVGPDELALMAAAKTATGDPSTVLLHDGASWRGKKATPWTQADIAAVQTLLDTQPALTPQLAAQRLVAAWPIETRALLLVMLDQINLIRSKLIPALGAITPQQALDAAIIKAGTLT